MKASWACVSRKDMEIRGPLVNGVRNGVGLKAGANLVQDACRITLTVWPTPAVILESMILTGHHGGSVNQAEFIP